MQKRNSSHDFSKVLVLLEELEKYRINTENYSSRFEVEQGPLRAIKEQWVALEISCPAHTGPRVRIPYPPPPKKPVIKPIAGFFLMSFPKNKWSEHTAFFALLNLGFTILPSAPEIAAFGQSKPCFHRLRRGNFRAVIKVGVYVCRREYQLSAHVESSKHFLTGSGCLSISL